MGIKLDWQIEAERAFDRAGEDPQERIRRRARRARLLLFTAGALLVVCAVAAVVWLRLYTVDNKLKQDLINTVQTETAALRLGDYAAFLAIQRTAPGGGWYNEQSARFKRYQDLKTTSNFKLAGNVLDTTIDGARGRALIEEVIDGVSYHTVWFYWRYNDGWRHVPSDYTFWGETRTISGKATTVTYNQLDAAMGQGLATRVERWWSDGCAYVGCSVGQKNEADPNKAATLIIQIAPDPTGTLRWDDINPEMLVVPSPLSMEDRARANVEIPPDMEDEIASQIAIRLVDLSTQNMQAVQTADAAWMRQMTIAWLSATFTGRGDPAHTSFVQSLKDHYGLTALATVLHELTPNADISIVGKALNQPLESLALDWRTFFQWRLDVEKTFLSRNDLAGFQALWDTANPQALDQMRQRMNRPTQATPQVQAVAVSAGADGVARATVQVSLENKPQTIIFRLVNGAWKRSG